MTTIYIPEHAGHSGIDVTWVKSKGELRISGWYDGCVGIEGETLTLKEFFEKLGITEKDCKKAFGG